MLDIYCIDTFYMLMIICPYLRLDFKTGQIEMFLNGQTVAQVLYLSYFYSVFHGFYFFSSKAIL